MTTKKILLTIGGVAIAFGFLVVCFVAAIAGFALYQVSHSEAASRARDFLRTSEKLQTDIGPVKDFGRIVTGNVSLSESTGSAKLYFTVIGERKTVNATVGLALSNRTWVVIDAAYVNSSGQTVILLNPYDTKHIIPLLIA
jgi:hypothetical protein